MHLGRPWTATVNLDSVRTLPLSPILPSAHSQLCRLSRFKTLSTDPILSLITAPFKCRNSAVRVLQRTAVLRLRQALAVNSHTRRTPICAVKGMYACIPFVSCAVKSSAQPVAPEGPSASAGSAEPGGIGVRCLRRALQHSEIPPGCLLVVLSIGRR